MANYAQIEDLNNGEIFRVVMETEGEVYFYNEDGRWTFWYKSEEGSEYHYTPAGHRLKRYSVPCDNCGTIGAHDCSEPDERRLT